MNFLPLSIRLIFLAIISTTLWLQFATSSIFLSYRKDPLDPLLSAFRPFVTVKFRAQLGNQLFQAAATIGLALDHKADYFFPEEAYYIQKESLSINMQKVLWRLPVKKIPKAWIRYKHRENVNAPFTPIPFVPNMRLAGYYESEKHFKKYGPLIKRLFAPSPEILDYLHSRYGFLLSHPKTVSIHVRTFYYDFLKEGSSFYQGFPAPDLKYLKKAVELFDSDSLFVVCSDHIEWCKKHLTFLPPNAIFIENEPHYHDFYLMSLCKNMILSNSTFSWWAAYLNPHQEKKVVVRIPWFLNKKRRDEDILCPDWITIQGEEKPPIPTF